jgi:8-oxo-dGTP pyrophosphatase MutT (NUDIX family)
MKSHLEKLKNRRINICGRDSFKEFSVFVPIVERAEGHSLLFEVRSENLNQQPNEICFPGGKIENHEENMKAAVRETSEELLLSGNKIEVIGELDTLVTPFNTIIYPYAGLLYDYNGTYNPDEVKEIFYVPLSYLMETTPLCHYLDTEMKPGKDFPYDMIQMGRSYPWGKGKYPVYFYTYKDKIIWGITARITYNFIELLKG